MDGLTEGRIVHYVLDSGPYKGLHRPAIVVRVWDKATGMVQLQVFVDGTNDGFAPGENVVWKTSVHHDPTGEQPYSWHWIEKA